MGYAGYAPGHKVQIATTLQQLLKLIKSDATLATMEKLTRNSAQAPGEEKFRKIRLTNEKIAAVITNVDGAVEAMCEMGWVKEGDGEFLVLPPAKSVSMREVREIDDARRALKKWEEEELKRRIAARNKANACPDKARLLAEMAADRAEQKGQRARHAGIRRRTSERQVPRRPHADRDGRGVLRQLRRWLSLSGSDDTSCLPSD